jgi:hypothetical protein
MSKRGKSEPRSDDDARVKLPLDPEEALKALLLVKMRDDVVGPETRDSKSTPED